GTAGTGRPGGAVAGFASIDGRRSAICARGFPDQQRSRAYRRPSGEYRTRSALNAVVRRDAALAHRVLSMDDRVDHYRDQIFRELLTYMMGDSSVVFPAFE